MRCKPNVRLTRRSTPPNSGLLKCAGVSLLIVFWLAQAPQRSLAQQKKTETANASTQAMVTPEEASRLEAVISTDVGVIRFEFRPDKAPRHVQQFIKLARAGFYDGSSFFRAVQRGLIQGQMPTLFPGSLALSNKQHVSS